MRTLAILAVAFGLPSQDADKIRAALKGVGERSYKVSDGDKMSGSMILKTGVEKEAAVLDDVLLLGDGDMKVSMEFKQTCKLDSFLSATTVEGKLTFSDKVQTRTLTVKDGKAAAKTTEGGKTTEKEVAIGDKAITHFALFRVVCVLEAKKGAVTTFDLLDVESLDLKKDCTLTCDGKAKTDVAGKSLECDKWTLKQEAKESTFWISGGFVVKASLDGLNVELEEKK